MRKTVELTIGFGERDLGKKFKLTEMSAFQAEAWAFRALNAMVESGLQIPDTIVAAGWGAIYALGIRGILSAKYEHAKPLLAEMMDCVLRIEDNLPNGRKLTDDDVEDVATVLHLRDEVFRLHANFSIAERLSIFRLPAVTMDDMPTGSTSEDQSDLSSAAN